MKKVGFAILAAGKGTRLKRDMAKALCPALGKTLIDHVLDSISSFAQFSQIEAKISVIVGHKKEEVISQLQGRNLLLNFLWQKEQKGTGDALKTYFSERPENEKTEYTFVVCADTPLIRPETFGGLWQLIQSDNALDAIAASFELDQPQGYGRIQHGVKGFSIIEEKDASAEVKKITEVNSGFYLMRTSYLLEALKKISDNNNSGEFYLTDVFQQNASVRVLKFKEGSEFLGVNTLEQLAEVTDVLRKRKLRELMLNGVLIFQPETVWIDQDVEISSGVTIYPHVAIYGKSKLAQDVTVENGAIIKNSTIEAKATIHAYSHLENSLIGASAAIGPFARLRPESDVGAKAKIGNFVEIKKSQLASGVKVSHLSYVGDAQIGENSNIGCGFITCNYDGKNKHKTTIGKDVFVGSDVQIVAPLEVGDGSFIAAGSTITKNLPPQSFAISRGQQTTKEGMATRFLKPKKD
jgi:bifunctional UDP-N-acetylglucosamine pyrophosphorylase / glucosamine-1-phosphate N-acetyltransferase